MSFLILRSINLFVTLMQRIPMQTREHQLFLNNDCVLGFVLFFPFQSIHAQTVHYLFIKIQKFARQESQSILFEQENTKIHGNVYINFCKFIRFLSSLNCFLIIKYCLTPSIYLLDDATVKKSVLAFGMNACVFQLKELENNVFIEQRVRSRINMQPAYKCSTTRYAIAKRDITGLLYPGPIRRFFVPKVIE